MIIDHSTLITRQDDRHGRLQPECSNRLSTESTAAYSAWSSVARRRSNVAMRARRSVLYVIQRFSTATSPPAKVGQSARPPANNVARSWKLRTARDNESLSRS